MFTHRLTIFRLAGIPIRLDVSWFIIVLLVTWSLASSAFSQYASIAPHMPWTMGFIAAIGLFASVLLHEFGHALTALRLGIEMRGITLFIFGGVAEMGSEPPNARAEFLVAIAGPIVSVVLCIAFLLAASVPTTDSIQAVTGYLGWINGALVVFNMLPAFPLDGGRVLRSALWQARGDLRWATRITSTIGSAFGYGLIAMGIASLLFFGSLIAAVWWGLLGLFLRNAAQAAYQQVVIRRALEGESISRFMRTDLVTVDPSATVDEVVNNVIYRFHHKLYPVMDNGALRGCLTTRRIQSVPRDEWMTTRIDDIVESCSDENTISPDTDAMQALSRMNRTAMSRLLVVRDDGTLVGILTLKDLIEFLSLRIELDDGPSILPTRSG